MGFGFPRELRHPYLLHGQITYSTSGYQSYRGLVGAYLLLFYPSCHLLVLDLYRPLPGYRGRCATNIKADRWVFTLASDREGTFIGTYIHLSTTFCIGAGYTLYVVETMRCQRFPLTTWL